MELSKNDTKVIKGFAIILMVLLHLFSHLENIAYTPVIKIGDTPLAYYIGIFGFCCVSIYCFCSGYAQYLLSENSENYFKGRLKSIVKLLINYELILVIFSIIGLFIKSPDIPVSFTKFIRCVFLVGSYNGAWWFLTVYVMLTLTSPVLYRIVKKFNSILVLVITLIIYCVAYYFRAINPATDFFQNPVLERIIYYVVLYFSSLILYVVGMIFYKHKVISFLRKKLKYGENKFLLPVIILIFVLMIACQVFITPLPFAPLFGLIAVICLSLIKRNKVSEKFFLFFGTHSTNIWLIHMFFYRVLFVNFVYIAKYPVLIVLFMFAICIAVSYALNYILKLINILIFKKDGKNV